LGETLQIDQRVLDRDEVPAHYKLRVEQIILYIQQNLDKDLTLKTLSKKAQISEFHFHRLMRAYLKEPLGSYVSRIRLETALRLIRYSNEALQDISMKIGYKDLSSFSKAFGKKFGIAPAHYRDDRNMVLDTEIDFHDQQGWPACRLKPKMISRPDRQAFFISITGRYGGEETIKAWEEMEEYARLHRLIGWRPELLSAYYDDPDVVNPDQCRSDILIVSNRKAPESGRVQRGVLKGGRFAVFRYKGPYEKLWSLYDSIYENWVLLTDLILAEGPVFERYVNYSGQIANEERITEIYIPVL